MKRTVTTCLLTLGFFFCLAIPVVQAQQTATMPTKGLRAELIRDVTQLKDKYVGLANAMAGKYDWRPGEGVRSVGETLMHTANANLFFSTLAGLSLPADVQGANMQETRSKMEAREKLTDQTAIVNALKQSFEQARQAIAAVPDEQLDESIQLFGNEATKRVLLNLIVTHMHEHLGQSIAYARSNGVAPPWSANN